MALKKGDRVASNVGGYYRDLPGTIIGYSPYIYETRAGARSQYIIQLDNGVKIHLPEMYIKRLEEDKPG